MTDLEMIFKAEKEKHDINKITAEDLNKKYFKDRGKMMSDIIFLSSLVASYNRVLRADMARGVITKSQYHARLAKAKETEHKLLANRI